MRYFKPAEFACRCCGVSKMDPVFLEEVDELRHRFGRPLVISSGYRCPRHNVQVSSTGRTGPHTTGRAADLLIDRAPALEVLRIALALRFTGIGVSQKGAARFIHVDNLPNAPGQPRPTIWTY